VGVIFFSYNTAQEEKRKMLTHLELEFFQVCAIRELIGYIGKRMVVHGVEDE
jgi:hypothetical protein